MAHRRYCSFRSVQCGYQTASYKRSSFINTVLGTVAMLPALRTFAGSSEEENHQEKFVVVTHDSDIGWFVRHGTEAGNATCSWSLRVECEFRVEYCYVVLRWSRVHLRVRRTCQILGRPVSHLQCLGQFRMEDHTVPENLSYRVPKVLNPSKYATKIMDEARTLGWRKRVFLLKLYTFLFERT